MENFPTTMAPLLLKNIIMPIFVFTNKSLLNLTEQYKFLQLLRYLLVSSCLFFHQFLLSLFPFSSPPSPETYYGYPLKPSKPDTCSPPTTCDGDSGIARAISQLLSIMNNIPVSSRKYETVRLLAETLIEENLLQCSSVLRDVNCSALSAAFSTTLSQLETAAAERGGDAATDDFMVERVLRAVRNYGNRFGKKEYLIRPGGSAEKLAAELLWLAEKMTACGCVEEAVKKWAFATNLAWVSLSYESRLQGALLKVSVFLIKEAKNMGFSDEYRLIKMKILMAWLPLLCQASNGTDSPVLSLSERTDIEIGLEEMIEELEEQQQENVLSLWLHHFTYNPSSDWPNLNKSYSSWCKASRKLLLLKNNENENHNRKNCKQQKII
ncbi:uncharacterized protein LOC124937466 [Impatiens glandulifera]|uniref:uncharacterized protein LOC124937466 n=1 Tax=Impatiens glandulifera TaxID=253017 RepID=UPI001FB159E8|nr:uncharacterized protein LOC124937466 [Impatiens glandulifera]